MRFVLMLLIFKPFNKVVCGTRRLPTRGAADGLRVPKSKNYLSLSGPSQRPYQPLVVRQHIICKLLFICNIRCKINF